MRIKPKSHLIVVVNEDRYDVYGKADSFWHGYLKTIIDKKGGIKDSVKPGIYTFRLEVRGLKVYTILSPQKHF